MQRKHRWAVVLGVAAAGLMAAKPALGFLVDMAGHWAAPLVGAMEARGIVNGGESGRFDAEAPLSRAQLAKLLVTGLEYENDARLLSGYPSRFSDIASWHWAKGYIESLAETGMMEGYPDGTFGPDENVTRVQLAQVLVKAMGLMDQARGKRFEPTAYTDDPSIPDWGRGAVHVARQNGIMAGFEDGSFRPNQPVTRAEGTVAIFRLLGNRGGMFHLAGTLVKWNPATLKGVVRDELGQERPFAMKPDAQYFRGGLSTWAGQVHLLDQVWVVLGQDGSGRFLDARYADVLLKRPVVTGTRVTGFLANGEQRSFTLQTGALVFVNGQQASAKGATGTTDAYLVLDRLSGEVRVLDAVKVALQGQFIVYLPERQLLFIQTAESQKSLPVDPNPVVIVNGQRSQLSDLLPGDPVTLAVNDAGAVVYLQVER